jgi:DNA-binding YbaB/EbfC family protein
MNDKAGVGGLDVGLNNLLKEAQKMQDSMKKAQQELIELVVVGKAGGGMVTVNMNGRHEVSKVVISKALIEDAEIDMIQDLVAAAVNHAVQQVEEVSKKKINDLTKGLSLPQEFMQATEEGEGGAAGG